jgi:hypothetical protein
MGLFDELPDRAKARPCAPSAVGRAPGADSVKAYAAQVGTMRCRR